MQAEKNALITGTVFKNKVQRTWLDIPNELFYKVNDYALVFG